MQMGRGHEQAAQSASLRLSARAKNYTTFATTSTDNLTSPIREKDHHLQFDRGVRNALPKNAGFTDSHVI